ncbi:hypothetical protein [Aliarcobacter lanthieri]|uniref:hypothetical protein n=1 Tax=Aliarcobacter lanthieri TaxID=1355374 RepID=UPI00047A071E|nr:hypothetical protein [Aliarcobacter lanthieri]
MKKIIFGTAITLTILFTGCSENEQEKNGNKQEFKQEAEIDFNKARVNAEKNYSKETVQKWINEDKRLKQLEKEYQEWNNRQGKYPDFSSFKWNIGETDKEKKENKDVSK